METFLQKTWNRFILRGQNYSLAARMDGHRGPINCFALLGDAELLASGGDDETVKIWDLTSYSQRDTLIDKAGRWGQVTCLQWIRLDNNVAAGGLLCFGTGRGRMVTYKRQRRKGLFIESSDAQVFSSGDSVETLAFDPVNLRVLVTSHHGKIKLYRLSGEEMTPLWTVELSDAIPRSAHFINRGDDILLYALESGEITCRDAQTAAVKSSRTLKSAIGNVDLDELGKTLVVDNIRSGFDVYPIHRSTPLHTFEIPSTTRHVRMVAFAEKDAVIVGGSDHGKVYVFDLKTSQLLQCMSHGKPASLVQTIITTTLEKHHLIVTGSSDDRPSICIWEKPTQLALLEKRRGDERRGAVGLVVIVLFFNIILAITSPAWFPSFKEEIISIFASVRGAAEQAATNPLKRLRDQGQETTRARDVAEPIARGVIERTASARDDVVIPLNILMQLSPVLLKQLGAGRNIRIASDGHETPLSGEVADLNAEEDLQVDIPARAEIENHAHQSADSKAVLVLE